MTLQKRIEYLSLAVGNSKSNGVGYGRQEAVGEFLTDLEDKLEVGSLQLDLAATLRRKVPDFDQQPLLLRLE